MKEPMKNIDKAVVLTLKEQVAYQPGQVVSKTLAQNDAVSVTLFAFDKDATGYQYINNDIDIYLKSRNAVITA